MHSGQVSQIVPGGYAAWNRGADFVQHLAPALAPEQGAGPDTVNRTIKLRLLVRPPVPVSTAISVKIKILISPRKKYEMSQMFKFYLTIETLDKSKSLSLHKMQ